VADLSPYVDDVPLEDLRSNPFQQGEANGDSSTMTNPSQYAKDLVLKFTNQGLNCSVLLSKANQSKIYYLVP